jgi:putative solute:sodium symporter small subunit
MAGRDFAPGPQGTGAPAMLEAKDHVDWSGIRNPLFVLLGLWIAFFLIIHGFIHALNKLTVPVVGLPLGYYVAAQGSLIVLLALLYLLAKKQHHS